MSKRKERTKEELLELVKNATPEHARLMYAQILLDWAHDDTEIRTLCKRVFTEDQVEGDRYGVPMKVTLVEELVTEIEKLRKQIVDNKEKEQI